MDDFFDDFEDDFEDWDEFGEFHQTDFLDDEPYELPKNDEDEPDDFNWKEAVILGGAMGWAYEEGLREAKWRQRKRKRKKNRSFD